MNKGPKALRYRAAQIYSSRVRVCNYSALVPGDCAPAAGDRAPAVLRRRRVPDLGQRSVPSLYTLHLTFMFLAIVDVCVLKAGKISYGSVN